MMSPLTPAAITYTLQELARRIGYSGDISGLPLVYGHPDSCHSAKPSLVIRPASTSSWYSLLCRSDYSLDWVRADQVMPPGHSLPISDSIPILFWSENRSVERQYVVECLPGGSVVFYADFVAAAFFFLSRWEEMIVSTRDDHDRFPATASVAYKQGLLDRPIIDEYAFVLGAWLQIVRPEWQPQPRPFSVKLSHDIDSVRSVSLRRLVGDLLKRRSFSSVWQTAQSLMFSRRDPYLQGCFELASLSEKCDFQSAFYFMAAEPSLFDDGYSLRARSVQQAVDELCQRGHEIGFHPGYQTLDDGERFAAEKGRIDSLLREKPYGGRQHYLRFRVPQTWRRWEAAGMAYDSTLSYADYEGFRCGTCYSFQPFDIEQDRQLDLLEIPLIVMEGTLRDYRHLNPDQGEERILMLARRCRAVNGIFTLLWHNTSLQGDWAEWADMYRRVLPKLAAL